MRASKTLSFAAFPVQEFSPLRAGLGHGQSKNKFFAVRIHGLAAVAGISSSALASL